MEARNKALISLLIYQGLTTGELTQLAVNDINLTEGIIRIKGTTLTNSRTIGLKTKQIMLLHRYIQEIHPRLLSRNKGNCQLSIANCPLLLTWRGTPENGEGIHYLIGTYKKHFPGRNLNPKTIRQSVIANLLKQGKDVRIVQEYAGHKSPDTTERYKQSRTKELQQAINKYHPLK
jgi:integrase/recombinase XerD